MNNYKKPLLAIIILFWPAMSFAQNQLAFPTAEGYGKYTVGGRGGKVYEVTNLNDSGEGSLRAAVEAEGSRTVVFRVSGTIDLKSDLKINNPYITIAGQTAPGDGICIKRYPLLIKANEVIIRYIRVRFGDESGVAADSITAMRGPKNIVLDHVSASWSVDETMSVYHCMDVTVQWCMVTESLYNSNHTKVHGYGGIWGGPNATYHHNLLAHHTKRNARICGAAEDTDFRNNVIYNWGFQSTYGGEKKQIGSDFWKYTAVNIVNNYYKPGPATLTDKTHHRILEAWKNRRKGGGWGKFYVTGNTMEGSPEVTKDNWNGGVQMRDKGDDISIIKLDSPVKHVPIKMQTAEEAYQSVLEHAGCSLRRDAVDVRIIDEVRNGYATYEGPTYEKDYKVANKTKKCGIIDSQEDVGGWPELKSAPAPADTDHDGMPDDWETTEGLNPHNPNDRNKVAVDGYTMLEKYLNGIAPIPPVKPLDNIGQSGSSTGIPPMVAHWPLDDGKGTIVTDVIGGLNGTLTNADTTTAWISDEFGGALQLDGIDDRIIVPHNPAFDFADEDFSVSFRMCWPKGLESSHEHILTQGDYSSTEPGETGKRWEIIMAGGNGICFIVDDDTDRSSLLVPVDAFITGQWIHVVAVRDTKNDQLRLYVDGVRQLSSRPDDPKYDGVDRTDSISNPQLFIIGDACRLDNPYQGGLDDVRLFRSVLTEQQIDAIGALTKQTSTTTSSVVPAEKSAKKPRIIVTSDGEIDDQCSMIRFLLYANEWDIKGIITSSSQYHWQGHSWAGDDWIEPALNAYTQVYPNLMKHEPGYPSPEYLRSITLLGNVKAEGEMEEVTAGTQLILNVLLDETDDSPIWLQAWGGTNTIARALNTIEQEHPEKMAEVAKKCRFFFIWEQDKTYQEYIRPHWGKYNIQTIISDQFVAFFYTWNRTMPPREKTFYEAEWMNANILKNHGPLCSLYAAHDGTKPGFQVGDFRSEGDSPAFLYNIQNGLRSMESPDWGGWGGRYVRIRENTWLDPVAEPGYKHPEGRWYTRTGWGRERLRKNIPNDKELIAYLKPIWRWTEALQNDFASRADWCVKSYENANHPPVVKLAHALDLKVRPGATVKLSALGTSDPDGDELTYRWWQYHEVDTYEGTVEIHDAEKQNASFKVPNDAGEGITIHIICEVTDGGTPKLTRYERVVVEIL